MTITLDVTTAAAELEHLATAYLDERLPFHEVQQAVDRIAHADLTEERAWARFEDLAHAVALRDGLDEGRIDWREICDDITGPDPSDTAAEIARERVHDAVRALLNPRSSQ